MLCFAWNVKYILDPHINTVLIYYLLHLQVTIHWISPLLNEFIRMVSTCELYLRTYIIPLKGSNSPHAYPKTKYLPAGFTPAPVFQCTLFGYKIMLATFPFRETLGHFCQTGTCHESFDLSNISFDFRGNSPLNENMKIRPVKSEIWNTTPRLLRGPSTAQYLALISTACVVDQIIYKKNQNKAGGSQFKSIIW